MSGIVRITTTFGESGAHIYLERRPWDDDSYQTLFTVQLHSGGEVRYIGDVKILRYGRKQTDLPKAFQQLPAEFCSLGQSLRYDREVDSLRQETGVDLRVALRDVRGLSGEERRAFRSEPAFERSLLRFASARYLFETGLGTLPNALTAHVQAELLGFAGPHELQLDFQPDNMLGRIAIIIGENGTGKTRFLDAFARALSGFEPRWIVGAPPVVSRVLALSCSAFDEFKVPRPLAQDYFYFYIGLRSQRDTIDVRAAARDIASVVEKQIRPAPDRLTLWTEVMCDLGLEHLTTHESLRAAVGQLGAGYKFACYVFTRLIAKVEERAFILFDEPENHTHPRLLSMMMLALHRIVERFKSFALVATHSPLIVQETPSRQVYILRCFEGLLPSFTRPPDETFGASLGELTRKIFAIDHGRENYEVLLKRLVERHGVSSVRRELADELALSARLLIDELDSDTEES